jgi:hypothetical protein
MPCADHDGTSMAAYLEVVAPYWRPDLFTAPALDRIWRISRSLPPVSSAGFECRLTARANRVDFQFEVPRIRLVLPAVLQAMPGWDSLAALFSEWSTGSDAFWNGLRSVWVELDLVAGAATFPRPSFFFHLVPGIQEDTIDRLAARFLPAARIDEFRGAVSRAAEHMPPGTTLSHVGLMAGRPGTPACLRVSNLGLRAVGHFMRRLGLPADQAVDEALSAMAADCRSFAVLLPADGGGGLGVECFMDCAAHPREWTPVLAGLQRRRLATRRKVAAVLSWPGLQQFDPGRPWPANIVLGDALLSGRGVGIFARRLNHVKLSFDSLRLRSAKAYLAFDHRWVRVSRSLIR